MHAFHWLCPSSGGNAITSQTLLQSFSTPQHPLAYSCRWLSLCPKLPGLLLSQLEISYLSHSSAAAHFHISSMTYWTFSTFVILAAMVHCIIGGCTNGSMKGCSFKGSFYLVPSKKTNLRNPWLSQVSCADLSTWDPCKWHVSSDHFKVSDFRRIAMVAEDVGYYRWQLKLDAISTLRMQGPVKQLERQIPWMAAVKLAKHRYKLNRSMSCRITAQNFQLTGAFLNIHHIW